MREGGPDTPAKSMDRKMMGGRSAGKEMLHCNTAASIRSRVNW